MRHLTATICLTIAVLLGSAGVGESADLQKGLDAYKNKDYATALRELKPLAENKGVSSLLYSKEDVIIAQSKLGEMYQLGYGVPKDDKTAVKWYRLAAEQGHADAQYNLGWMYRTGRGVPQDDKTAVKWFRLAAEQGDADAQNNLGMWYQSGLGVIQDNVYAHMWYNIAASQDKELAFFRDQIEKKMTRTDISAAKKLARECVRKNYKGC